MLNFRSVSCINMRSLAEVEAAVVAKRIHIFWLDGSNVTSKNDFLREASIVLPQPKDLIAKTSLDAFNDSLSEGLSSYPAQATALFWLHANKLIDSNVQEFLTLVSVFEGVMMHLLRTDPVPERRREFYLFMFGDSDNFPEY